MPSPESQSLSDQGARSNDPEAWDREAYRRQLARALAAEAERDRLRAILDGCDDAAIERGADALIKIARRWGLGDWQVTGARELALVVLRAVGERSVETDEREASDV